MRGTKRFTKFLEGHYTLLYSSTLSFPKQNYTTMYTALLLMVLLIASPAATNAAREGSSVSPARTSPAAIGEGSALPPSAAPIVTRDGGSDSDGEPSYEGIANCEDDWRRCIRECRRVSTVTGMLQCNDNCGSKYIGCADI